MRRSLIANPAFNTHSMKKPLFFLVILIAACAPSLKKDAENSQEQTADVQTLDFSFFSNWTGGYSFKMDSAARCFVALVNPGNGTFSVYQAAVTKKEVTRLKSLAQRVERSQSEGRYEGTVFVSDAATYQLICESPSEKRRYWVRALPAPAPLNALEKMITRLAMSAPRVKTDAAVEFESRDGVFAR